MNISDVIEKNRADQQRVASDLKDSTKVHYYLQVEEQLLTKVLEVIEKRRALADSRPDAKLPTIRGRTMGLRPEEVDLDGAKTLGCKLRRIAEQAPSNEVNLTESVDLLLVLGASEHDRNTLKSMVHRRLDRLPEFEQIARGWWRLRTDGGSSAEEEYRPSEMETLLEVAESVGNGLMNFTAVTNSMGVREEDIDMAGAATRWQQVLRIASASPTRMVSVSETIELMISSGVLPGNKRNSSRKWLAAKLRDSPDFSPLQPGLFLFFGSAPSISGSADPETKDRPRNQSSMLSSMEWMPGPIDYSKAKNLNERLVVIAQHTTDHLVEPTEVAARMRADGVSEQRRATLIGLVRRKLYNHPNFESADGGWFRLVRAPVAVGEHGESPNRVTYISGKLLV